MARGSKDWMQAAPVKTNRQLLREGNAFSYYITFGADAGNFTFGQLINPSGSGVNMHLDQIVVKTDKACPVYVSKTTDTTAGIAFDPPNRKLGENPSVAELMVRYDNTISSADIFYFLTTDVGVAIPFDDIDLWIPEEQRIEVCAAIATVVLDVQFGWYEFVDY